jgi:predicted GNAT family N-acyltransferase
MIIDSQQFKTGPKRLKIECICDYCGEKFLRTINNIERSYKILKKDSCDKKKCFQKKKVEIFNLKYGCDNPFQSEEIKQKIVSSNIKKYGTSNPTQNKEIRNKQKKTCVEKYGVENPFQSELIKEKIKQNNLLLYGVENSFQRKEVKEKQKETIKKKYKVDHYSETQEYKDKVIKTNLDRYGVEQTLACPKIQEKIKETNIEKYGVENPLASKEIREKIKQTCLELFGVENPLSNSSIRKKIKETNIEKYGVENPLASKEIREKIKQTCLELFGVENPMSSPEILSKMIKTCIEEYGRFPTGNYGKTQDEIKDWLNSFGFNFSSDYEVLENKEIDLLDKDKKIGIEYCGLYWHNENSPEPRDANYHIGKYRNCLKKNIQLLTIFEDEWKFRKKQCQSHIKSILGIASKKVFARKCEIKEISREDARLFFESYHIQGSNKLGVVFFGLFYENDLCAVMSLGRHNRQTDVSKKEITLDRLCFKEDYQVVGGASKLFSKCLNWAKSNNYKKIISFSDNRWSLGNVYVKMGFVLEKEYGSDYSYVNTSNPRKRISKQSQRKKATACPENLTEHAWALERGLSRIYDCGKKRWVFNI